jgi:DNA modification methylase
MFNNFNFELLSSPQFKEDSVREALIIPILSRLGYSHSNLEAQIVGEKHLVNPFFKAGSKQRKIEQYPDYLLQTEGLSIWVLDAKSPSQKCEDDGQVYGYAIHPEVRAKYFAMCNGRNFVLWETATSSEILSFNLSEIEQYWDVLEKYLSPKNYQKSVTVNSKLEDQYQSNKFDYLNRPLLKEIKVEKQSAKRHFGVHGYFTKQAWNVVNKYIQNFTKPGDLVLDPFIGSGVTAVESMMLDRRAIGIDLNPLPIFITQSLTTPVDIGKVWEEYLKIKTKFEAEHPLILKDIDSYLAKYSTQWNNLKTIKLDKTADVDTADQLFSLIQTAELAFLKYLIKQIKDKNIQSALMLAFSSSLNKHNLTFHYTKTDGGGDSSAFRYYRYRLAPNPGSNSLMKIYETKLKKVINAKQEITSKINPKTIDNLNIYKGDATNLSKIEDESIDYIYTDPPYGSKISYLDLSAMWNGWLDLPVTSDDFQKEAIEGGSLEKSKKSYSDLIAKSIEEMYRVLKFDRWMSFVFAHKDPHYWHIIVETAEKCGFEYAGAVKQANGQTSFKKRQNPFTVISGQLIINFKKVQSPKNILKANLGSDIAGLVIETIEGVIAKHHGATLEEINDALVLQGLELGFLDILSKEYSDLTPILTTNFDYEKDQQKYFIRKQSKFKAHIPLDMRINYYLISLLRRRQRENNLPTFDEITWEIIPLLKNGITPEDQDVLKVLEDVAERTDDDRWRIKTTGNETLF